jgi:hypothetical protein
LAGLEFALGGYKVKVPSLKTDIRYRPSTFSVPVSNGCPKNIKTFKTCTGIGLAILTVSSSELDILQSYQFHANCSTSKPVDLDGFLKVVKSIDNFWLSIVKLPREIGS